MKFQTFVEYADEINEASGNIDKEKILAKMLKDSGSSIEITPRFVQGEIFAQYDQRNLGISSSIMRNAISDATDVEEDELKSSMTDVSDMGELFELYDIERDSGQQTLNSSELSVDEVYSTCEKISELSGQGSQQKKIDYVVSMISEISSFEAKYLTRLILGNMSIGVGEGTVRKGIARAYDIDEDIVERAIMFTNDTGFVASKASVAGESGLKKTTINIGRVPLRPMKAKKSQVTDALDDIDYHYVYGEYKYDGFRIQAHVSDGDVSLYTRRLDEVTSSLPDVVEMIEESVEAENIVLDGEIVGYESDKFENPLSYQETQKRIRRKYDINEMIEEIPVQPSFFDILYHDDSGLLIDKPLDERKSLLKESCSDSVLANSSVCASVQDLQDVMTNAEDGGHEGAMAKDPNSTYKPNSRGKNWLKLKPSGETIDAVVIGGEYGDGKRSNYIASYEIAIWNRNTEELESVGDVGTGFTDKEFEDITSMMEEEITEQDGRSVTVRPSVVFEIEFEEVQPSPEYESGYGLRFPRFKRIRDTKSLQDADSISRLEDIAEDL